MLAVCSRLRAPGSKSAPYAHLEVLGILQATRVLLVEALRVQMLSDGEDLQISLDLRSHRSGRQVEPLGPRSIGFLNEQRMSTDIA